MTLRFYGEARQIARLRVNFGIYPSNFLMHSSRWKSYKLNRKCQSNDRLPPVTVGSGTLLPLTCREWVWCGSVGGCYCVSWNWTEWLATSIWWTRRSRPSPSIGWNWTAARSNTPATRWQQGSTRRLLTTTRQLSGWRRSPCCHAICHDPRSWLPADQWSLQVSIYGHVLHWLLQIPFRGNSISGEFAKLRKATIFLVMSVCPSVRPHVPTRLPLHAFASNLILEDFICWEDWYFTWRPRHI
jgi:hypothetical protein